MSSKTGTSTGTATKTKKPSISISPGSMAKPGPSSSPASAAKRLPGSAKHQATPADNSATTNGVARPSRRQPRVSTRNSASENLQVEKKPTWTPQPYVITEDYILKTYGRKSPSLIVHLHPTYFRFDQQDGSFSYQSEMRSFIQHLKAGTIPHDMLEEFRRDGVRFYEGWLIVKIFDHKSIAAAAAQTNGAADDEKPFSINNYNHFITPSPYAPYPSKDHPVKMERSSSTDKENLAPVAAVADAVQKPPKPKPRVFYKALRPTLQSQEMDLMLDFIAVDPKARKAQTKAGQPPTPIGTVPPTPTPERPPPAKKQKLRIDPKDHLEYEARLLNGTAPPLYLEPAEDWEDMERIHQMLTDPFCQEAPPLPKSRKRTVAELAADDAHAKDQEQFMLIMGAAGANAVSVDTQPAAFQPRFERFNALDKIKSDLVEKKRQEAEKRVQEDELRRSQQQQLQDEENRRKAQQAAIAQRKEQAILQSQAKQQQMQQLQMQQRQNQENLAAQHQQQQQQQQNAQRRANAAAQQPNGIPPNMQTQIMAAQGSSPVIRQGTPNIASSPAASNARPMARSGSQAGGAASPPRPGSSLQHGHPSAVGMMRQPSGQGGPSRNGTPQIPHSTPGMPHATPVMRQGTPAQHMAQQSPMVAMGTPQMQQANMQGQMANGMHPGMNPQQQMAALQRRHQIQQMQMQNGQMMAHMQQQAAMRQQAQAQAQAQAQGTPQQQHMSPNPQQNHQAYNAQVRNLMQQQMRQQHGSPVPQNQMSPQQMQQMQNMRAQQQQQQQQAMMQGQQQPQQQGQGQGQARQGNSQVQQIVNNMALQFFKQLMVNESQKYGQNPNMIPQQVKVSLQAQAREQAMAAFQQRQQMRNQQMAQNAMNGQLMHPQMQQMNNVNRNMAMMQQQQQAHQNQQAQQMQQMHIQNAQAQLQQGYLQQMQQMQQQMHPGQQGPG